MSLKFEHLIQRLSALSSHILLHCHTTLLFIFIFFVKDFTEGKARKDPVTLLDFINAQCIPGLIVWSVLISFLMYWHSCNQLSVSAVGNFETLLLRQTSVTSASWTLEWHSLAAILIIKGAKEEIRCDKVQQRLLLDSFALHVSVRTAASVLFWPLCLFGHISTSPGPMHFYEAMQSLPVSIRSPDNPGHSHLSRSPDSHMHLLTCFSFSNYPISVYI